VEAAPEVVKARVAQVIGVVEVILGLYLLNTVDSGILLVIGKLASWGGPVILIAGMIGPSGSSVGSPKI
jgi:hypothetical protein